MFIFELKEEAAREIDKLSPQVRDRILRKLKFYSSRENPLKYAEKIKDPGFGEYKFRIGDYRAIFDLEGSKITILKVGHRKDIYRKL